MKNRKIVLVFAMAMFAASIFAQARHGGAGSALSWHEWSSRPEWVKNLDEYDWEYALGSRLTTRIVKPNLVPRSVMELIDRQVGRGANGFAWAYDAYDTTGNVIDIYMRSDGLYWWIMVSKYWFD